MAPATEARQAADSGAYAGQEQALPHHKLGRVQELPPPERERRHQGECPGDLIAVLVPTHEFASWVDVSELRLNP